MPDKPNILLIAIDSIRADHMSCYGYDRLTTPHIDKFAQSGILFENTFSPHIPTTPAYASMLTGLDCFGTQVVALRHQGPLRPEAPTAAEIFRRYGYNTTSVGFKGNPSSRGFDSYIEFPGWGSFAQGRSPKAQNLNDVTMPELERLNCEDKPWFVMLRHMDPHAPYLPPEPYERMFYHGDECDPANRSMDPVLSFKPFADFFKSWMPPGITDKDYVIAQYDGAIAYMDACIQSIFEALDSMGILDNTIIALNGDHGETLYDHELWFDHHGIFDNVLHVPLIIRYPDRIPTGGRLSGFNQHKDLLPTLLDLAGIPIPETVEGISMVGEARRPYLFGEVGEGPMATRMIRQDQYKLIYYPTGNRFQLFDLDADPQELNDLSETDSHAALRQRLTALLVDELYGNDEEWLQEGELVGLPETAWQPVKNRELSGQRGLHWPPPPLDLSGRQVGMPG